MKCLRKPGTAILIASLMFVVGCTQVARFKYVDDAGAHSSEQLNSLASRLEQPEYMGQPVDGSTEMRHEALVDLRKQGDEESELANLLTEQFPADTRAVPFWGGKSEVDGREAWIVAEAWGLKNGKLDKIRLWVFDRASHDVITSVVAD